MVLFIFNYTKDASDQDLGVPSAFVVLIDHVIEDHSTVLPLIPFIRSASRVQIYTS